MIDITERAVQALLSVMARAESPPAGLRIVAAKDGCSEPNYSLGLVGEGAPDDHVITSPAGITMFVDDKSLPHLMGATLDYQETEGGSAFTFLNPNTCPSAKPEASGGGCGCGKGSCS